MSGIRSGHQPGPGRTEPSPTEQAAVEPRRRPRPKPISGEIIITAQGRRQVLQDVPIAVTAVGGDEMQNSGATDIRQLNQLAPSLLVSSTGTEANGSARIRGIGTVGDNPGLESSVAVFIDGVYRSRSGIGLNELGEIDRVEVLRGPQGTLFGRNASAGLINIISKRPSYNFGRLWRSDDRQLRPSPPRRRSHRRLLRHARGRARRRLREARRLSTTTRPTTRRSTTATASSRAASCCSSRPTRSSFRLIGDYTWRKERCCAAVYVNDDMNDDIGGLNDPAQNNIIRVLRDLGQDLARSMTASTATSPSRRAAAIPARRRTAAFRSRASSTSERAELTSITGWRHYKADQGGDFDYGTVDILYRPADGSHRASSTR